MKVTVVVLLLLAVLSLSSATQSSVALEEMHEVIAEFDAAVALEDFDDPPSGYDRAADEQALEQEQQDAAQKLDALKQAAQDETQQLSDAEQQRAASDLQAAEDQISQDQTAKVDAIVQSTTEIRQQTQATKEAADADLETERQDQAQKDAAAVAHAEIDFDAKKTAAESALQSLQQQQSASISSLSAAQQSRDESQINSLQSIATARTNKLAAVDDEIARTEATLHGELEQLQQRGEEARAVDHDALAAEQIVSNGADGSSPARRPLNQ